MLLFKTIACAVAVATFTGCSTCDKHIRSSTSNMFAQTNDAAIRQQHESAEALYKLLLTWMSERQKLGHEASETGSDLSPDLKVLMANLEPLNCRIETRMLFVDKVVRVREKEKQAYAANVPLPSTILFITSPVTEIGGDCLLFLSSTQPAQMTILSIASNMKCRVIYDSWDDNDLLSGQDTTLDPIAEVRWLRPGEFLLKERRVQSMSRAAFRPRTFLLTVSLVKPYKLAEQDWEQIKN